MNEESNEPIKCPKCGNVMKQASRLDISSHALGDVKLCKAGDMWGDTITPFYCDYCGYIELFLEKKLVRNE
jgi:predicted nucleic-acid-binding Zn-ribbon protein